MFGGLALGCSYSLVPTRVTKKHNAFFKNNPSLNSVVLCSVCVSLQLQKEKAQLKF